MSESILAENPVTSKKANSTKKTAVNAKKPAVVKKPAKKTIKKETPPDPVSEPVPQLEDSKFSKVELSEDKEEFPQITEGEVKGKKEKIGKKVRKQQTLAQINKDLKDIVETMQQELASGKLDKFGERILKKHVKELTQIHVKTDKFQKKPTETKKTQSGFSKPCKITATLAEFASWDPEIPRSRIEVNNLLCTYIRENNLQMDQDKRVIVPDARLAKLLNFEVDSGKLNFAEMQKYISKLLIKNDSQPVEIKTS